MARLFDLKAEYLALLNTLEEGMEDIPEEVIMDTIEAVQGELEDKAVSIAVMVKDLTADVQAFKTEEQNLATRRRRLEKSIESLKFYVAKELTDAGISKIKDDPRAQISFRKSESVEIPDEQEFIDWAECFNRPDFLNVKTTIDKVALKKSIKESGLECPFAQIVEKNNIQIK